MSIEWHKELKIMFSIFMVTLECSLNIIRVYIEWHKKLIIMFSIFMVTSE